MKKLVIVIALLMPQFLLAKDIVDVNQLNKTLKKQNATWFAKDSGVVHADVKTMQRMLGLREDVNPNIEFSHESADIGSMDTLPASVDWRAQGGSNWVSPILNQANCGSCVAFAAVGVFETQLNIAANLPGLNIRLSPQQLFACGGGACDYGWWPSSAATYLMRTGIADEACMPYTSGATGQDVACNSKCSDSDTRVFKLAGFTTPTRGSMNLNELRKALQNGPLMTSMTVYADFIGYGGGIYKHTTGKALGGHAISIVGYNDQERYFVVRNSWGVEWGEGGFVRVSYDDNSGIGVSTWGFEVPSIAGYVSMISPRDYAYLSGVEQLEARSTYASSQAVTINVRDAQKNLVWSGACGGGTNCSKDLDTTQLPDGAYEIWSTSQNNGFTSTSTYQKVFIANQKPNLSLSFSLDGNPNLANPVSDRIVFDVTDSSSTVPFSSLEFHVRAADGAETVKTSYMVLPSMTLGWRTTAFANGNYEIWMTGRVKTFHSVTEVTTQHYNVKIAN